MHQYELVPQPVRLDLSYCPTGKLEHKVALITGGNYGIGRVMALHLVLEGTDVVITHYPSDEVDVRTP